MVRQVQQMARELCIAKGDLEDIGLNWTTRFLRRYLQLKSRFVPPLDKDQVLLEDLDQIMRFFELF